LSIFAFELAQEYNTNSKHDQIRLRICELLVRFYDILADEGMFFSGDVRQEVSELRTQLCRLYAALSNESVAAKRKAWKMTPKFHLFAHLCEVQAGLKENPRYYWTYADEDMVGHMMEVARSCHPMTMNSVAMFKWLILMFEK
jgi:hypothetical protein